MTNAGEFGVSLGEARAEASGAPASPVRFPAHWSALLGPPRHDRAQGAALARFITGQRWFRAKSRSVRALHVGDVANLGGRDDPKLVLLDVTFASGELETYATVLGAHARERENAVLTGRLEGAAEACSIVDESHTEATARRLLELLLSRRPLPTQQGEIVARRVKGASLPVDATAPTRLLGGDHSNTCFCVGEAVVVKLHRKIEEGQSVEVEMLRELAPRAHELHVPKLLGSLELVRERRPAATLASFMQLLPSQGDAWQWALDEVHRYFEQVLARGRELSPPRVSRNIGRPIAPGLAQELAGGALEAARRLGRHTGELHRALSLSPNPDFVPQPFGALARRAGYQTLRTHAARAFDALERGRSRLPEPTIRVARALSRRRREADRRLRALLDAASPGMLIRVHGDYHLGQVLYGGRAFGIIDFEGEPGRALADRRRRRSPLVDVAGMLRSFHYAAESVLRDEVPVHGPRDRDEPRLMPWARAWTGWVANAFVSGYLEVLSGSGLLPDDARSLAALLDVFILEKALYELLYELDNRPEWVGIPLAGLAELLR